MLVILNFRDLKRLANEVGVSVSSEHTTSSTSFPISSMTLTGIYLVYHNHLSLYVGTLTFNPDSREFVVLHKECGQFLDIMKLPSYCYIKTDI